MNNSTIVLNRSEVKGLLSLDECIHAVESAFRMLAEGNAARPQILGLHAAGGGLHIKAGSLNVAHNYFVAKANANFPGNPKENGLPTIQGVVIVSSAENGRLLSLMDSIELTVIRTGAATAVAAKYLSRKNSKVASIIGCGEQGKISIRMLTKVRKIERFYVFDIDRRMAERLAKSLGEEISVPIIPAENLDEIIPKSDILVTSSPSRQPFVKKEFLPPGIFVAAVGADNEDKQEVEVTVLENVKVVTDITNQAAEIGELHHAIEDGKMTKEDVYAELGEIISGKKPGRLSDEEIILFDSTGMALQDVAVATIVYEKAIATGKGLPVNFNS